MYNVEVLEKTSGSICIHDHRSQSYKDLVGARLTLLGLFQALVDP